MGIYYLHDGGQLVLPAASTLNINGSSSVGVAVDDTTVPLGTIGIGLTINLNGAAVSGQAASTVVVALNGGSIALVQGFDMPSIARVERRCRPQGMSPSLILRRR
jgi:hypothetical protein